jgi:AcrR family transcriptional regulator
MGTVAKPHSTVDSSVDDGAGRALRADARRNYQRIVAAARTVFANDGGGASMEGIAREAGVGVGTLYRHFPKRIDIVEAVYRTDVEELVQTAERVVAELEPEPAVVEFLEAFVQYARTKRTLLTELREAFDQNPELRSHSRDRIDAAMELVIGRAQRAGVVRTDVAPSDLLQLLGPMCTSPTLTEGQYTTLLNLIIDGLRHSSPAD